MICNKIPADLGYLMAMGALQGRKDYVTRTTVPSRQLKGSLAIVIAREIGTEFSAEAHVGYLSPQCLNTKEP